MSAIIPSTIEICLTGAINLDPVDWEACLESSRRKEGDCKNSRSSCESLGSSVPSCRMSSFSLVAEIYLWGGAP